jgi:hypothetical protein
MGKDPVFDLLTASLVACPLCEDRAETRPRPTSIMALSVTRFEGDEAKILKLTGSQFGYVQGRFRR